jgi:hypothetical protein
MLDRRTDMELTAALQLKTWLRLLVVLSLAAALMAQTAVQQPTLKVLYKGGTEGEDPFVMVEVSPGKFLGLIEIGPGIFSITAQGNIRTFTTSRPNRQVSDRSD